MHPHLKKLRDEYEQLRSSIETIQNRAIAEKRDLSEVELRTISEQTELAKTKYTQIEQLSEHELRTAAVAKMGAQVDEALAGGDGQGDDDGAGDAQGGDAGTAGYRRVGSATAKDRDPGHYRSAKSGGKHSFFSDVWAARSLGDEAASQRLVEHARALATGAAGSGLVVPKWLTDEYAAMARQGRALASVVRPIPLGSDARPMTLPKQTAGADAVNPAEQAAENDVTPSADKFDTDVDTVAPKPTRGEQIVSRQMLDMSSPAIDLLIYGDLLAEYNRQVEAKVVAAWVAAAGAAVTTFATEAAFTGVLPDVPASDAIVDAAVDVYDGRKLPADIIAMNIKRWGKYKKLRDNNGRKLIPDGSNATQINVDGVGTVNVAGEIEGLGIILTEGTAVGPYPDNVLVGRASDTLLFESDVMQFRYEEVNGPESIKLGIWAYTAVLVRFAGSSVKRIQITAAA